MLHPVLTGPARWGEPLGAAVVAAPRAGVGSGAIAQIRPASTCSRANSTPFGPFQASSPSTVWVASKKRSAPRPAPLAASPVGPARSRVASSTCSFRRTTAGATGSPWCPGRCTGPVSDSIASTTTATARPRSTRSGPGAPADRALRAPNGECRPGRGRSRGGPDRPPRAARDRGRTPASSSGMGRRAMFTAAFVTEISAVAGCRPTAARRVDRPLPASGPRSLHAWATFRDGRGSWSVGSTVRSLSIREFPLILPRLPRNRRPARRRRAANARRAADGTLRAGRHVPDNGRAASSSSTAAGPPTRAACR